MTYPTRQQAIYILKIFSIDPTCHDGLTKIKQLEDKFKVINVKDY